MPASFSRFATEVQGETAFTVLAKARQLQAAGKEVIELEIGDSPFPTADAATAAGIAAIEADQCHYGPSSGLPDFRDAAAEYMGREYGVDVKGENVVAGPGAKTFQTLFCEAFLNPGDGVLVFSPHFPTYPANIHRRGARMVTSRLEQSHAFRPNLADVERFLDEDPHPKAIFLNSPHNPTGGIALPEDIAGLADIIRGQDVALFSDEPYDRMVWSGSHHTPLAEAGMLDQCVSAFTFSKSYSMSGWRLGFAVSSAAIVDRFTLLTNTALSCVPPFTQIAGAAALRNGDEQRESRMQEFRLKVEGLAARVDKIDGIDCLTPGGTFYVFPSVKDVCNRLGVTSHGLALFVLEGADDNFGVACLGGECFGEAGAGFLRLSCAEPEDRLRQAVDFLPEAFGRTDRLAAFLETRPEYRLDAPYV
ncbi:MAG: aminotransferase class I/II-fold pyridoxal phosphate-dependent enzyme [Pirellulaceae bacterium]|jgi:aspartate aminotransferase|nr:aminotransferase class I/II-fold pyridoxal phosphate-dependent enzyme [Pirellulaceae bacterium]MDP7015788.1 aminotransferase class I/II-fold pyridoxal phosphate-dependent enzyme [Pirellulaceae bacterium]